MLNDHRLSRDLYENLLVARRNINEHASNQRSRKTRVISETAAMARSILHKKVRQLRASAAVQPLQPTTAEKESKQKVATTNSHQTTIDNSNESSVAYRNMPSTGNINQSPSASSSGIYLWKIDDVSCQKRENHLLWIWISLLNKGCFLPNHLSGKSELPKVGDVVHVSSLGRKGTVLKADPLKEEILVQAGMMKVKLKLIDVETWLSSDLVGLCILINFSYLYTDFLFHDAIWLSIQIDILKFWKPLIVTVFTWQKLKLFVLYRVISIDRQLCSSTWKWWKNQWIIIP